MIANTLTHLTRLRPQHIRYLLFFTQSRPGSSPLNRLVSYNAFEPGITSVGKATFHCGGWIEWGALWGKTGPPRALVG